MGLFRKRINPNKRYNMSEVLSILSQPEFKNYTSVELETGEYNIITIERSKELESRVRERKSVKNAFYERINGGENYRNKTANIINFNAYHQEKNAQREQEIG